MMMWGQTTRFDEDNIFDIFLSKNIDDFLFSNWYKWINLKTIEIRIRFLVKEKNNFFKNVIFLSRTFFWYKRIIRLFIVLMFCVFS